jgi:hypothetical protein
MEPERIALSQRERDRLKVLREVEQKHVRQVEATGIAFTGIRPGAHDPCSLSGCRRVRRSVAVVQCFSIHLRRVGPGNFTPSRSQIPDLNLSIHPARATH